MMPAPQGQPMGQGMPPQGTPPGMPQDDRVTIDSVMALFHDAALRKFRIDIETDSTITGDESQERQDRQGLIEGLTKLVEAWGPIVQANQVMAPLAGELMLFGIRAFRCGRGLEEVVQETVDKFEAMAGQPKPPPQPSPDEMIKLQGTKVKTQAEITKAQLSVQQAQMESQAKSGQAQMEARIAMLEHALQQQQGHQTAALANQAHGHATVQQAQQHGNAMDQMAMQQQAAQQANELKMKAAQQAAQNQGDE